MVVVPEPGALTQVLGTHNTQSIRLDNDRFNLRVGANAYATGPANSLPANLPHIVGDRWRNGRSAHPGLDQR